MYVLCSLLHYRLTSHASRITHMDLSIIIVNYNSGDTLIECLSSIYERVEGITFEVILVDNHSADGSPHEIKRSFPQVYLIENERNIGFSRACNRGIKRAGGDFLLFLNPDIIMCKSISFPELLDYMKKNRRTGLLGCKLINLDGTVQSSCRRFPDILTVIFKRISVFQCFSFARKKVSDYLKPVSNYTEVQNVDWLLGAFLLTSREIINKIGPFDERFFIYFEDVDFCRRVHRKGYEVCYYPLMEVLHYHKRESAKGFNKILFLHIWSGIKYFWKWCGEVKSEK
ncbi:MAG TPA: glycosyltransferase family 2 protein [Candidatus Eremiobacteraeota bacterium]|nr:glycosyltransferase family 2 protein [Candidatus Eremiobacteraeota bacterium]